MNALTMNALTMNALTMNALTMTALTMTALSASNLAAIQDPSTAGGSTRLLLEYVVSCALDATQSFSFTWTDESNVVHDETYWGALGLANHWPTKPLSTSNQEWISACVIARVNWYGVSVPLSARGAIGGLRITDPVELGSYNLEEGAFWGNLFAESPHAYSCSYEPNDGHSRSSSRDCAAGHINSLGNLVDCGTIHRLGSCATYCDPLTNNGVFHPRCQDGTGSDAVQTSAVVTVFLQ
jgi:hypothetical protein